MFENKESFGWQDMRKKRKESFWYFAMGCFFHLEASFLVAMGSIFFAGILWLAGIFLFEQGFLRYAKSARMQKLLIESGLNEGD